MLVIKPHEDKPEIIGVTLLDNVTEELLGTAFYFSEEDYKRDRDSAFHFVSADPQSLLELIKLDAKELRGIMEGSRPGKRPPRSLKNTTAIDDTTREEAHPEMQSFILEARKLDIKLPNREAVVNWAVQTAWTGIGKGHHLTAALFGVHYNKEVAFISLQEVRNVSQEAVQALAVGVTKEQKFDATAIIYEAHMANASLKDARRIVHGELAVKDVPGQVEVVVIHVEDAESQSNYVYPIHTGDKGERSIEDLLRIDSESFSRWRTFV